MKATIKRLAILGNGFDIAHGYLTSYQNFYETVGPEYFESFRKLCEDMLQTTYEEGSNWYQFEDLMDQVAFVSRQRAMEDSSISDEIMERMHLINEEFEKIQCLLKEYLINAQCGNDQFKLSSIARMITDDTAVINFNYTNTAKRYSDNINYVHGTLSEDYIIFGYPLRMEFDFMPSESVRYSKERHYEMLEFHRWLAKEIKPTKAEYKTLMKQMWECVCNLYSEYGEYTILTDMGELSKEELPEPIRLYGEMKGFLPTQMTWQFEFKDIESILIIGHSLKADEYLIGEQILKKCTNTKTIYLFRYGGESEISVEGKRNFITKYCPWADIEVIAYD